LIFSSKKKEGRKVAVFRVMLELGECQRTKASEVEASRRPLAAQLGGMLA